MISVRDYSVRLNYLGFLGGSKGTIPLGEALCKRWRRRGPYSWRHEMNNKMYAYTGCDDPSVEPRNFEEMNYET